MLIFFRYIFYLLLVPFFSKGQELQKNVALLDFANNHIIQLSVKEDWANRCFYISNNKNLDTLKVCNVSEIDSISVLNKRFLQIVVRDRSGSGEHLRITKLFSSKSDIIHESLSLISSYVSMSLGSDFRDIFKLHFNLNSNGRFYKINLVKTKQVFFEGRYQKDKSWRKSSELYLDEHSMEFHK